MQNYGIKSFNETFNSPYVQYMARSFSTMLRAYYIMMYGVSIHDIGVILKSTRSNV